MTLEPLTAGGHIRTADLLTSIAKWLRSVCREEYPGDPVLRSALRGKVDQIDKLAQALEARS